MFDILVDEEIREKRKNICFSCEFLVDASEESQHSRRYGGCLSCLMSFAFKKQCSLCGCFIIPKTALTDSTCPKGKW